MGNLIILGSSNAIPTENNENTHLFVQGREHNILVDCVGNPLVRLEKANIDLDSINDIILTHFHPDHVSGVPLLLMDMWLLGRRQVLNLYGFQHTLDRIKTVMELYGWAGWPNFFPVNFCQIPEEEGSVVVDFSDIRVTSSPVKHFLPNMGLRFEFKSENKTLVYSCDTEPCPAVVRLAEGADILLHEAAGPFTGHSSASQAAEIARQAEVGELYLIHYPSGRFASGDLIADAKEHFPGRVTLATDFMKIPLD